MESAPSPLAGSLIAAVFWLVTAFTSGAPKGDKTGSLAAQGMNDGESQKS